MSRLLEFRRDRSSELCGTASNRVPTQEWDRARSVRMAGRRLQTPRAKAPQADTLLRYCTALYRAARVRIPPALVKKAPWQSG